MTEPATALAPDPTGIPLLEVRGVAKSFPGVKALQDMHLTLRRGEVLALVGENGAGKSTLMKLLSGIYTPDEGEFYFDGAPYQVSGPKHASETGISIIHQEFNLMPDLTVAQNIFIGREPRSGGFFTNDRALNRRAAELIDRLQLPLDPKQSVGTMTVAKQQMVEIAKALSYDGRVLIMDEPTAALNDAEVATLHELIRRFVTPETGVIYISHKMDELKAISDRITVIRDGRYIDTLDTETTTMKEVIARMVGREITSDARPENVRSDRPVILSVNELSTKHLLKDVSFELLEGEILGFAGLMGAGRTEVARAIVGADPITAGTISLRGKQHLGRQPGPGRRPADRLPVRGPQAPGTAARPDGQRQHRVEFALGVVQQGRIRPGPADAGQVAGVREVPTHQDPVDLADHQESLGWQSAEGRHRQVAAQGLRHPDLRRADPGHRRRGQGGDLPAAQRAGRGRQVDHHDLLGTA